MNRRNIIIGVVIVILIYLLYLWFFGDSGRVYLSGMRNAEHTHIISGRHLPAGGNADYTYSIWLYIANWNYRVGEAKGVFVRNDRTGNPAPWVALDKNLNNIIVTLATYPSDHAQSSGGATTHSCVLENIPLQAWANVLITLNNRALDLYLDGKLVRTCVLPGVPKMSSGSNLVLCPSAGAEPSQNESCALEMVCNGKKDVLGSSSSGGSGGQGDAGFEGFVSNFQYFSRAVNPREAYAIYREGPGGSNWLSNLFNKYRLKIAFMKDNHEVDSFEI